MISNLNISNTMINPYSENALLFRAIPEKTGYVEPKEKEKTAAPIYHGPNIRNDSGDLILGQVEEQDLSEWQAGKFSTERRYPRKIKLVVIPNRKENETMYDDNFGIFMEGEIFVQTNEKLFTTNDLKNIIHDIIKFRDNFWMVKQVAYASSPNLYTAKLDIISQDVSYNDGILVFFKE